MRATELAEKAQRGDIEALKALIELRLMAEEIEQAIEVVKPLAIDHADKWHEKTFEYMGAIIEKRSGPCTWHYDFPAYHEAKERLKYIEKIAQAGGGMDSSGNEIGPAHKVEGRATIAIKFPKIKAA